MLKKVWLGLKQLLGMKQDNDIITGKVNDLTFYIDIDWNMRDDKKDVHVSAATIDIKRYDDNGRTEHSIALNHIYVDGRLDVIVRPLFLSVKCGILKAYKTLVDLNCNVNNKLFRINTIVDFVKFVKDTHNLDECELRKVGDVIMKEYITEFLKGCYPMDVLRPIDFVLILNVKHLEYDLVGVNTKSGCCEMIRNNLGLYVKTDDGDYLRIDGINLDIRSF